MKKILYIMHVDWHWIKQRPQYIAEELAKENEVLVLYIYSYQRKKMQVGKASFSDGNMKVKPILRIPVIDHFPVGIAVNGIIMKSIIRFFTKRFHPDFVYLTSPDQINLIGEKSFDRIVYDCMDDHVALCDDEKRKKNIVQNEAIVVDKARIVFVTSEHLKQLLNERYGNHISDKSVLVRNGYNGSILKPVIRDKNCDKFVITYIGTISSWFDNELIVQSLKEFPQLEYEIIGPIVNGGEIIKNDRVRYLGTVEHNQLPTMVQDIDCLIMPFKLNNIVAAVDPVKFYEYINYNKNIISIYYKEIERFSPFVEFYSDYREYNSVLQKLMKQNDVKYSEEDRQEFLENNRWSNRVDIINSNLDKELK